MGEAIMQKFLRRPAVQSATGLTRSSIYDLMAAGKFPKSVRLTGNDSRCSVAWLEAEIAEWQKQRIAERDGKQAPKKRRAA
jgi:prophage regulatory protein